jgi:hypothetical protein
MTPKLFSKEKNTGAQEFKEFLPVNVQLMYETVAPALALAEQNFIIPILGRELFEKLAAFYETETGSSAYKTLLKLVQYAEFRLAYWNSFNELGVMITDGGVSANISASNRLFQNERESLLNELKTNGFNQLDTVIEYLEENIDLFPEFEKSSYFTKLKNSFIPNTATFQELYNINNSRLVFLKMKYFIEDVEQITVPHYIGRKFMEAILDDIDIEKYATILTQLRKFIVYMAIYNGISELHKVPTEKGLIFEKNIGDGKITAPLSRKELNHTAEYYQTHAEAYRIALMHHLNQNKELYPEYAEFAGTPTPQFRGTHKKTFFA